MICALIMVALSTQSAEGAQKPLLTCRPEQRVLWGHCVSPLEVRDDLCSVGEIFEFGAKGPACVPCSNAQFQLGMNFCAAAAADTADHDVTAEYRALLKLLPECAERLTAAEEAWRTFRDRFCAYEAGLYEGGSIYGFIMGSCELRESQSHLARLKELPSEWSKRVVPPED